jgi:putative membrane protein
MQQALLRWVLTAVAILIVANIVPGFIVSGILSALIAAVVIGFVNGTLGFVLKVVTFPLTILTMGLFWLVINALMIQLASFFIPGFHVESFAAAFFGGIVLSIVNMLFRPLVRD